jgi:hypothetical protein
MFVSISTAAAVPALDAAMVVSAIFLILIAFISDATSLDNPWKTNPTSKIIIAYRHLSYEISMPNKRTVAIDLSEPPWIVSAKVPAVGIIGDQA